MTRLFVVLLTFLSFPSKACFILFLTDGNQVLVGNHEDWFARDAAVRIIPPSSDSFGSVIFTFASEGWAQGGMNDQGLFFDGAYTPHQEVTFDSHVEEFQGYIWQSMLDRCKNVDEAIAFLSKYRLPELEEVHMVIADAEGQARVLGVKDGKLAVKSATNSCLIQSNFNPWHPELSDEPVFPRYDTAQEYLVSHPSVSKKEMENILKLTHQNELTVYSNIYDLKNKTITTFSRLNFEHPIEIKLDEFIKTGDCLLLLDALVTSENFSECLDPIASLNLNGVVRNAKNLPIPFVNIGIISTDYGTISDPDGSFELNVPLENIHMLVTFSAIGYHPQQIRIKDLLSTSQIMLFEKQILLDEVVIEGNRNMQKGRMGYMKGRDGSIPFDTIQGGGAIAMLLEAPETPLYVDEVWVRLMYNSKDTLKLRLHFLQYDSVCECPGKELLTKEIILKEQKRFGWLRFDVHNHRITIKEKRFFVGFEWLDDKKTRDQILSGLKDFDRWKKEEFKKGNPKVEVVKETDPDREEVTRYKYHGNMMKWPGWNTLPPFTGLMIETGKKDKTRSLRTFERRTSFSRWIEKSYTLNTVVIGYY